jgi:diacylglycerol kinase (ATP)
MQKKSGKGVGRIIRAFTWSIAGIRQAFAHEAAFRQECFLFVVMAPIGLWLGRTGIDRALLVGSLFIILIVELLNSGLEATVDRISEEHHQLAGRAKDMGSAAVFLSLVNAFVIWLLVLFT